MLEDTGHRHDTDGSLGDTLIVTKEVSSEDKMHIEWKKRYETARKLILGLDQERFWFCLDQRNKAKSRP